MSEEDDEGAVFCFVPARVEGLRGVELFAVHPDRIAVRIGDEWQSFFFAKMARDEPDWRSWWQRLLSVPKLDQFVGERDFGEGFFRWYTDPEFVVFTPPDECEDYGGTHFCKIHQVMWRGPYQTFDLG